MTAESPEVPWAGGAGGRTLVHGARLITDETATDDAWVLLDGATVAAVGRADTWRHALPARDEPGPAVGGAPAVVVDAAGALLVPGYLDLHCHGGGGASYGRAGDRAEDAAGLHRRHGTTRTVLSLVTDGRRDMVAAVRRAAAAVRADDRLLGLHLEGPFLAPGHRGAHRADHLRLPDPGAVAELLDAADGTLLQVTLATELEGADRATATLVAAGVRVAVGHTGADYETAARAFDAGASILTHAFNAMPGVHHRAPGPVAAAIDRRHVTLEVVNDGIHVHPAVVRMLVAAAPGRVALVTDAVAVAGLDDGVYGSAELAVELDRGLVRIRGTETIAGSTLTLDRAVRRAVEEVGMDLPQAVAAATSVPARAIGRDDRLGRLGPGSSADALLLDPGTLAVRAVWVAGRRASD